MDKKLLIRLLRRPVRLDRRVEGPAQELMVDLDLLQRSFQVSLLMARMTRQPSTYLSGRSGAARES